MKAILINAREQTVQYIDLPKGNQAMYDRIGYGCTLVELVSVEPNNDGLFCDDEGVFEGHSEDSNHHFGFLWCISKIKGTFQQYFLICGNALIVGCDESGTSVDSSSSLKDVEKRVMFLSSTTINAYKKNF